MPQTDQITENSPKVGTNKPKLLQSDEQINEQQDVRTEKCKERLPCRKTAKFKHRRAKFKIIL